MPGMEVHGSPELPSPGNYGSLKAHKALPRRKVVMDGGFWKETSTDFKDPKANLFGGNIRAWIPDPPKSQADSSLRLPLTPPALPRDETSHNPLGRLKSNTLRVHPVDKSGLYPATDQRSPPTPERTPPRKPMQRDALTPPPTLRQPTSRTDSFITAREHFDSDNEGSSLSPSILNTPTQVEKAGDSKVPLLTSVGLGLGLDMDDQDKTPVAQMPRTMPESWEMSKFDGFWNDSANVVEEDPLIASQPVPMPRIAISDPPQAQDDMALMLSPTLPAMETFGMLLSRGPSLRQRVELNKYSPASASTEQFAEQIQWPLDVDKADIDNKVRQVDNRRFSQMSGTSTVIEAIVLDTMPQRRQTLRHMSKNVSLRTASSQTSGSNRSSLISSDTKHRFLHRNMKIANWEKRTSLTPDSTSSVASDLAISQKPTASETIVPQRRSSLRSSAAHSKRQSKGILTLGGQEQSTRPTTAPDGSTGYFDVPPRRVRTIFNSLDLLTPSNPASGRYRESQPVVPARSSSLSAPTSRNVSRTTSFTSTTIRAQAKQPLQLTIPQQPAVESSTRTRSPSDGGLAKATDDDWSGLRHRSTLVTPFSMTSMNSSTPGTLEVNEATAVNIYPHHNKSVLVVQQMARVPSDEQDMSAFLADNNSFVLARPPPEPCFIVPDRLIDSPLRNPREPPRPPAFAAVPPTLGDRFTSFEADRQFAGSDSKNQATGRFSLVRRAFSARRFSEPFIAPLTRSLSKRNTVAKRPNTSGRQDRNLSPFWRPRGFWDDFSDSDSDFGNDGFMANSIDGITKKRVIPGPAAIARRLGSLKLNRRSLTGSTGLHRSASNDSLHSYKFIHADQNQGLMPRLGYQVQFVGFKGLHDRFEKLKLKREEDRREKERTKLRQSIGPVVLRTGDYIY